MTGVFEGHVFARHELSAFLKQACPGAMVVRLRPDGTVTAYAQHRRPVGARTAEQDAAIADRLRAHFTGVDWQVPHDYYLSDGLLRAAPGEGEHGFDPAADGDFGSAGRSPALLMHWARGRSAC